MTAIVVVGVGAEVRQLTWSDPVLMAHCGRAADSLTAARRAADHTGHLRPSEAEQTLHAAAAGGAGLSALRSRLLWRALAAFGILALFGLITYGLVRRNRIAHYAGVGACMLMAASSLAALLPAWRAWRNVHDGIVAWEIGKLVALALLALAAIVVGMLSTARRPAAG